MAGFPGFLFVAAFIAVSALRVAYDPPGGVWHEGSAAGTAILAEKNPTGFIVLMSFNSLTFFSSLLLVICYILDYPFFGEAVVAPTLLSIATISMAIVSGVFLSITSPEWSVYYWYLLVLATSPIIVRVVIEISKCVRGRHSMGICDLEIGQKGGLEAEAAAATAAAAAAAKQ